MVYSIEEIKDLIRNNRVNISNFNDIIKSLSEHSLSEAGVVEILEDLSEIETIPLETRENLKDILKNTDGMEYNNEQDNNTLENDPNGDTSANNPNGNDEKAIDPTKETIETVETVDFGDTENPDKPNEKEEEPKPKTREPENTNNNSLNESISLENDVLVGAIKAYAVIQGVKVISSNVGINAMPSISFELNEVSKPYIDNLLLTLYSEKNMDLDVNLTRVGSTNQEMLTISLPPDDNMSLEEQLAKGREMFEHVNKILKDTDKNKDYEEEMPSELRSLKDKFVNDDPNIPNEDFKVGYSHKNGENTYYIVANSKEEAIELSELMGYEIKQDRGGNVFELNTAGREMAGTKLDKVTENLNDMDEVKDTKNGISDLDIDYNNRHYDFDEDSYKIINFINDVKDPSTMAMVEVDVPEATPNQRVVHLASSDGVRDTIVINNGKDFDNYFLPKMADAFGSGSVVDNENAKKVVYDNGNMGYEALSSDNTYFRLNNYDSDTVNQIDNQLNKYSINEEKLGQEKANQYTKKLGEYPTNNVNKSNEETGKASYAPILVFILVCLAGFLLIYFIY